MRHSAVGRGPGLGVCRVMLHPDSQGSGGRNSHVSNSTLGCRGHRGTSRRPGEPGAAASRKHLPRWLPTLILGGYRW